MLQLWINSCLKSAENQKESVRFQKRLLNRFSKELKRLIWVNIHGNKLKDSLLEEELLQSLDLFRFQEQYHLKLDLNLKTNQEQIQIFKHLWEASPDSLEMMAREDTESQCLSHLNLISEIRLKIKVSWQRNSKKIWNTKSR